MHQARSAGGRINRSRSQLPHPLFALLSLSPIPPPLQLLLRPPPPTPPSFSPPARCPPAIVARAPPPCAWENRAISLPLPPCRLLEGFGFISPGHNHRRTSRGRAPSAAQARHTPSGRRCHTRRKRPAPCSRPPRRCTPGQAQGATRERAVYQHNHQHQHREHQHRKHQHRYHHHRQHHTTNTTTINNNKPPPSHASPPLPRQHQKHPQHRQPCPHQHH